MDIPSKEILTRALAQPKNAVFYELSRALRAAYPESSVLETEEDAFQVHGFAHSGGCRMKDAEGTHTHWTQGWDGRRQTPHRSIENGCLAIEWEGHALLVFTVGIYGQYCRELRSYVVGQNADITHGFFAAACRWGSEVHGEVLVFREGRWSKSEELFDAIRSTTLDSLVLPAELKDGVRADVFGFFEAEATYDRYRLPWKRGLLFLGPPGNGKTHMIKGLANELGRPVLYVRSFNSQYGTPHANIGACFARARDLAPCLLVLEDLDALVDNENRSYFLNEMDGFYSNRGILTVATTNHPERLDPAILERPSRFDRKFTFTLPEATERSRYLAFQNAALEANLQLSEAGLARAATETEGFSYAYLKELFLSSMMAWLREGDRPMDEVLPAQIAILAGQMRTEAERPEVTEIPDPLAGMPPQFRAMMARTRKRR